MKKSSVNLFIALLMITTVAVAGCAGKPVDQPAAPDEGAAVVPYSKGPSSPPYVKGPSSPPPGVEVPPPQEQQEQSVTETENVKYELPVAQ